jgi:hypothetical protein
MKFIDCAFALAVAVFLFGAFVGAVSILLFANVREFTLMLLQARMVSPLQTVSRLGDLAVFLVVFVNNSVSAVLSFAYPFAIGRITWTPPLSKQRSFLLLSSYTLLAAFLSGFFSLGAPLGTAWVVGGTSLLLALISGARIHGPLEFCLVLMCIAEPLRLSRVDVGRGLSRKLFDDRILLLVSVAGLLLAAAIEVFLGI